MDIIDDKPLTPEQKEIIRQLTTPMELTGKVISTGPFLVIIGVEPCDYRMN